MRKMTWFVAILCLVIILPTLVVLTATETVYRQWKIQVIDTMKYSRDLSRAYLQNPSSSTLDINAHVEAVATSGATHIAIATPYDAEFIPVLKQWVLAARRNNMKVWFRGNFSGWEGYSCV